MPAPFPDVQFAREDWKRRRRQFQNEESLKQLTDAILDKEWMQMPSQKRCTQVRVYRRRTANLQRVRALVESGQATPLQQRFVANGGYTMHPSAEASDAASRASMLKANNDKSRKRLNAKLERTTGCSVDGCPMETTPMICLIDDDHRDGVEKQGLVSAMVGEAAQLEALKTDPKCKWHHFQHTRDQVKGTKKVIHRATSELPIGSSIRALSEYKDTSGCQHPLHSKMPYGSLLPSAKDDTRIRGFLEVSHFIRGVNPRSTDTEARCALHLQHLQEGKATVLCSFCHCLFTMLEDHSIELLKPAKEDRAPMTVHHFHALEALPAGLGIQFITEFQKMTRGVDWKSISQKERQNQSVAAKNRQKRPREAEEQSENKKSKQHSSVCV
jgi:hypothetical protein